MVGVSLLEIAVVVIISVVTYHRWPQHLLYLSRNMRKKPADVSETITHPKSTRTISDKNQNISVDPKISV